MSIHGTSFTLRIIAGALVAAALLAATTAAAASPPAVTSERFAPGWQDHAKGLIFLGGAGRAGNELYLVPPILPKGRYVVISRVGDKAELVDGYQFEVPSVDNARIKLWLPTGYANLEALPVSDLPAGQAPARDHTAPL